MGTMIFVARPPYNGKYSYSRAGSGMEHPGEFSWTLTKGGEKFTSESFENYFKYHRKGSAIMNKIRSNYK